MVSFRKPALWASLCVLFLLLSTPPLTLAQPFVYGLNQTGKLSVNGTILDNLKTDFAENDGSPVNLEQRWEDLVIDGADRYALRRDGLVALNGRRILSLNFFFAGTSVGLCAT